MRHLVQKQLAVSHIETSELAKLFHEPAMAAMKSEVGAYITRGIVIHSDVFDPLLRVAMVALTPEYRRFFYSPAGMHSTFVYALPYIYIYIYIDTGSILRKHFMDAEVEASDVNATAIQTILRMRMATKVKNKMMQTLKERTALHEAHEKHMKEEVDYVHNSSSTLQTSMLKMLGNKKK